MLPFQMVFQINKESRVKISCESAVHVLNWNLMRSIATWLTAAFHHAWSRKTKESILCTCQDVNEYLKISMENTLNYAKHEQTILQKIHIIVQMYKI